MKAIEEWRRNKRGCGPDSIPHLSDLNVFAYLLGGIVETQPGRAWIGVGPRGTTADLRVEFDPQGPHLLGWWADPAKGQALHDLLMARLLAPPAHAARERAG